MFILDVLRYDAEDFESLVRLLNDDSSIGWRDCWPSDFSAEDVSQALRTLVSRGLVETLVERQGVLTPGGELVDVKPVWYRVTQQGLQAWESWTPPKAPGTGRLA